MEITWFPFFIIVLLILRNKLLLLLIIILVLIFIHTVSKTILFKKLFYNNFIIYNNIFYKQNKIKYILKFKLKIE